MLALERDGDAGRDGDRILADARHGSEHLAEDFAADIGGARLGVGHDAARRGQDRDAEAVDRRAAAR